MTENIKPRGALSLFFRHAGLWLFLPIVFGGIAGLIGSSKLYDASEFSELGEVATAEITSTTLRESRGPGTGNVSKIPYATVRFAVNGEDIVASARISQSLFDTARPGDTIDILYLPADPTRVELEAGINLKYGLILGAVFAVTLAVWLFIIVRALRFARQALHVRDTGVRTKVAVTDHKAPLFTNDKKPESCLVWTDTSGNECRSLPIKGEQVRKLRVGQTIAIYEIPESSLNSYWEGDVGRAR